MIADGQRIGEALPTTGTRWTHVFALFLGLGSLASAIDALCVQSSRFEIATEEVRTRLARGHEAVYRYIDELDDQGFSDVIIRKGYRATRLP